MDNLITRQVRRYYQDLNDSMNRFLAKCGASSNTITLLVEEKDGGYLVRMDRPIELNNIPYSSGDRSKQKKLLIHIDGTLQIKRNDNNGYDLVKYNTRVSYCKMLDIDNEDYEPVDGYHYDMTEKVELAHPLFHVQRDPKIVKKIIDKVPVSIDTSRLDEMKSIENIRIVTPQVDFFSLIPMLLADHGLSLENENQDEFFSVVEHTTNNSPFKVDFSTWPHIQKCFQESELKPGYWYGRV